jgi:hypothetical protein
MNARRNSPVVNAFDMRKRETGRENKLKGGTMKEGKESRLINE